MRPGSTTKRRAAAWARHRKTAAATRQPVRLPGRIEQPRRSERNEQNRTTGQAPREDRLDGAPAQNRSTGQAPREERTNRSSEQNRLEQERGRAEQNRTTTGQGAASTRGNVTINLTPEK